MTARDPHEPHRATTPLELLYDLVFVVAFGVAGTHLGHALAAGHVLGGVVGFVFVLFAVVWAWLTFVGLASAYDPDDWIYRVLTMVQMAGVTVLALGIPSAFRSFEEGGPVHNEVLVAGYVVMRVGLLLQYLRAARDDPQRRGVLLTYVVGWTLAQVGWVAVIFAPLEVPGILLAMLPLYVIEVLTPWVAERRGGLPWHAGHLAERFSALVIVGLGEGVVGTVLALSALVDEHGWTVDTVLVLVAGLSVTFGMWWVYFAVPTAQVLHAHRERVVRLALTHLPLYMAIAAVGAGFQVVANVSAPAPGGPAPHLGPVGTVLCVAVPVAAFVLLTFLAYVSMMRADDGHDRFHLTLLGATGAVLAAAVGVVALGGPLTAGVLIVAVAPFVTVLGFEIVGHRHVDEDLRSATTG